MHLLGGAQAGDGMSRLVLSLPLGTHVLGQRSTGTTISEQLGRGVGKGGGRGDLKKGNGAQHSSSTACSKISRGPLHAMLGLRSAERWRSQEHANTKQMWEAL